MPELNQEELAARYGWSMAVLNSSPELSALFQRAVAETWTPDKFTAELRNTGWFKTYGEAARQATILKNTDPATWNQRIWTQRFTLQQLAVEMGARVSEAATRQMAEDAITYGWSEAQMRHVLSKYVTYSHGQLWGQAQANETELRKYAQSMGVRVSDDTIRSMAARSAGGEANIQTYFGTIQNMAESAFPQFKERFQAGETLDQIADPYKQSMAQLLELSPEAIDNFDPTVRGALSAKDAKTGKPASKTLWEFENDLRRDKRWAKTKNAQDAGMSTVNSLLQSFGLIS